MIKQTPDSEIALVPNDRKLVAVAALTVAGLLIAIAGVEGVRWLAARFPQSAAIIEPVGVFAVALVVGLLAVYPMLSLYGLTRPISESWPWTRRSRRRR